MTTPQAEIVLNLQPLERLQDLMQTGLNSGGYSSDPIGKAVKQWAIRYKAWVQQRFDRFSKGGGDWEPLAESTIKQRRGTTASILRDTGTLYAALDPVFTGRPGSFQQKVPLGIAVGFGGGAGHPSGNATIAEIAGYHQRGNMRLPARQILVQPPTSVVNKMGQDLIRAIEDVVNGS